MMPECSVKDFLLCLDEELEIGEAFDDPELDEKVKYKK